MVSADQQPVVVAAFDVDGTLTSRDCVVPFLVRIGGWSRVLRASVRHPVLLASTALGRGDRDRLKEVVVGQLVRGRNRASLDELGRRFALDAVAGWLRADTLARLRWHRESGHRVVLVSASLRHYLDPLAAEVLGGVDAVLCTDVETDSSGTCTGRLDGGNCRGAEKSRRLSEWIGSRSATIYAYGDSSGDTELLAMAHHPVRVRGVAIPTIPVEVLP
jgi:phosphatidylglycerophosphatase C